MKRNVFETALGAVVLLVAALFLVIALRSADVGAAYQAEGYTLRANFTALGSLGVGSDVRLSGVKVGSVTDVTLDPETYLAQVSLRIREDVTLPLDTTAQIASDGLLGGHHLQLEPGGEIEMLQDGEEITYTQAAVSLEQMIGKLIFSLTESAAKEKE